MPLEDVEEDDESADEGAEDEGAEDEGAEDEGAEDEGADAKSRRFSFGDGDAPPSPVVDAFAETLRAADASERLSESKRRRRRNRAAAERAAERDAIAKKLGLETEEARRARASLRWRRARPRGDDVRGGGVGEGTKGRLDARRARRETNPRRAKGARARGFEEERDDERSSGGETSVEGGVAIEDETKEGAGDDASAERGEGAEDDRRE